MWNFNIINVNVVCQNTFISNLVFNNRKGKQKFWRKFIMSVSKSMYTNMKIYIFLAWSLAFKSALLFFSMTFFYSGLSVHNNDMWMGGENCNEIVSPQKPIHLRHFMSYFHISWVKRDILNSKSIYTPSRPSETVSQVLKHF